jgi:hypothetical protein
LGSFYEWFTQAA